MTPPEELRYYQVLLDSARAFNRALDLQTLIDDILDRSREVVRAEACSILLPDERTGELILYTTHPKVRGLPSPPRVPPGKGIAGAVFASQKPLNIPDVTQDPRHFGDIDKESGFRTKALLTIPLLDQGRCLGVMQALNPLDKDTFSDLCLEIFEAFGILIVGALVRLNAQDQQIRQAKASQELRVAQEIQASFLPAGPIVLPVCRTDVYYKPAHEIGGDFYFVHPLRGDRVLLGLGDVSGKGIPAALTMARATAMISTLIEKLTDDLGSWVGQLNALLSKELSRGTFIGITFMLADATKERLNICAAGQHTPLRYSPEQPGWDCLSMPQQLPLGVLDSMDYQSTQFPLHPGGQWLLVSDGVTEARSPDGSEVTIPGLVDWLPVNAVGSAVVDELVHRLDTHTERPERQHDDISLFLMTWRGKRPQSELSIRCEASRLCDARRFVEAWSIYAGFPSDQIHRIVMACDEASSNVLRHAYEGKPGPLNVHANLDDASLTFQLTDEGGPIDPKEIHGRNLDDLRPGGLGTVVIQKVFDTVHYQPSPTGTTLTLKKSLPAEITDATKASTTRTTNPGS